MLVQAPGAQHLPLGVPVQAHRRPRPGSPRRMALRQADYSTTRLTSFRIFQSSAPVGAIPAGQGADAGWTYGHLQLSTRGRYDVPAWRPLRVGTAPPAVAKRPPHRAADPARELSSTRLTSLRIFRSSPHAGASFTRSASGRLVHLPAPRGSGGAWRPGRLVAARPSCSSPFPRAHALIPGSPPRGCTNGSPPARAVSTVVDG